MTAAVVVNDRMATEGEGKTGTRCGSRGARRRCSGWSNWRRRRWDSMRDAGDQVVMENVSFSTNVPEVTPAAMEKVMDEAEALLHAQPGLMRTLMIGTVRGTAGADCAEAGGAAGDCDVERAASCWRRVRAHGMPAQESSGFGMATGGGLQAAKLAERELRRAEAPRDTQRCHEHVSEQIRREPAQSTRLLESWISAPAEE